MARSQGVAFYIEGTGCVQAQRQDSPRLMRKRSSQHGWSITFALGPAYGRRRCSWSSFQGP